MQIIKALFFPTNTLKGFSLRCIIQKQLQKDTESLAAIIIAQKTGFR